MRFDASAQPCIAEHNEKALRYIAFWMSCGFCKRNCKLCTSGARGRPIARYTEKALFYAVLTLGDPSREPRERGGRRFGVLPLCPLGGGAVARLVFLPAPAGAMAGSARLKRGFPTRGDLHVGSSESQRNNQSAAPWYVAICQSLPQGSLIMARRSPYGTSVGSSSETAPALMARLYVASVSST